MSQYYKLQEEFFVDMQRCIGCKYGTIRPHDEM